MSEKAYPAFELDDYGGARRESCVSFCVCFFTICISGSPATLADSTSAQTAQAPVFVSVVYYTSATLMRERGA